MPLPVVPDSSPCDGGHGRCCAEHRGPIDGFDLVRLWRGDDAVDEDLAARELYRRALSRWDRGVAFGGARRADELVGRLGALDDARRPLRTGARGARQLGAYACIDAFALP